MKRRLALALLPLAVGLPRLAQASPAPSHPPPSTAPNRADEDLPPRRPDAPDLRHGHWLIELSGGLWAPSSGLYPAVAELGQVALGTALQLDVGIGLGRYAVLNLLSGGFGYGAASSLTGCDACALWSLQAGPSIELHPTQGFAFDPWVRYGLGYRHNVLVLGSGDERVLGVDVAKLALGGTWYPYPLFGLGPMLEADLGVRTSGDVSGYALLTIGLRLSFDPLAAGTRVQPVVAQR